MYSKSCVFGNLMIECDHQPNQNHTRHRSPTAQWLWSSYQPNSTWWHRYLVCIIDATMPHRLFASLMHINRSNCTFLPFFSFDLRTVPRLALPTFFCLRPSTHLESYRTMGYHLTKYRVQTLDVHRDMTVTNM